MPSSHELAVALRRRLQILSRRVPRRDDGFLDPKVLQSEALELRDELPEDTVRALKVVHVPVSQPPWTHADVGLFAGDEVTVIGAGRAWLSAPLQIWIGPRFQLWCRVGQEGPIFRSTGETNTFTADHGGPLQLASYFPGEWADATGELATDPAEYQPILGDLRALVIVWHGSAADGLRKLAAIRDPLGLFARELERQESPAQTPEGWEHLWFLGDSAIYRDDEVDGGPCIRCNTHRDVGIIRREVDLPLDDDTTVEWRWKVDRLPSKLPEDTIFTHDYMSLAVEFEDGNDITYYWSAGLPVDTAYWCPLPTWHDHEFHVVVRSGKRGLGEWQQERRTLREDYERWMGEPPSRIVRVWLIANSLMQRIPGDATYADIVIRNGDGETRVL